MNDFQEFEQILTQHREVLLRFLADAESEARKANNKSMLKVIGEKKASLQQSLTTLETKSQALYPALQKAIDKETNRLEKQVDALTSDNILLEYKKKDLLLLTQKLEDAYEEISAKNEELTTREKKIFEQAAALNEIHEQVLEKNRELEQQKEALLDQSDYLHEANETITRMHEQVQAQKDEIEKKNDELLALNNEKNNLISIVAHDLKSPLNQIKGMLAIMKISKPSDAEAAQYIAMMEGSTKRLTDMIAKILDVEAIDARKINMAIERACLRELLTAVIKRFEITASQKSISMESDLEEAMCLCDRTYAEQIFENLISNAIKFSDPDKKVFVSLKKTDSRAIVSVRDQGPGITDEDKRKLFTKYQKLTARPTANETSTGLGLSIVKKYVDAMNGEIWCESTPGNGATFFVGLPLA